MFTGGAIGVEMATAGLRMGTRPELRKSFEYALLAHVEELLEMFGVPVFVECSSNFLLRRLAHMVPFAVIMKD